MTEVYIRVSFLTIKFKEKEHTFGMRIKNIQVNGRITKCMEKEKLYGKMGQLMRDSIKMIKNMALAYLSGQMEESMWVNGKKGSNMEKDNTTFLDRPKELANGYRARE